MALADNDLDEAEKLLKELPENKGDATMLWALLYQKKNDVEKALEVVQKRLYSLVSQVQSCLALLMSEKMEPNIDRALEICGIYRELETLFGYGAGMSDSFLLEIYMRAGRTDEALDSLQHIVDAFTSPIKLPNPLLFSEMLKEREEGQEYPREFKKMLLTKLKEEEAFAKFRGDERFKKAMEKLNKSII